MLLTNEIITASPKSVRDTGKHLFWTSKPEESLVKSIHEFGQTTPILAQRIDNGLELIAGHARLAILRASDTSVLVRLVEDADEQDKGLLYITDNATRSMNDGMRLSALLYFSSFMDFNEVKSNIFPRLGVKPKSKDAKLVISWMSMPENWQGYLAAGKIPLAAGAVLSRMDDNDKSAVEPLFSSFSWSRSNAVNMLNWLFETSKMTSAPINEVMQAAGLNEIMKMGLSPKDVIARLTAATKAARYPELSVLQTTFSKAAQELTAGTKWRMTQPNNFETGGAEIAIQIKDATQLKKAIKDLEIIEGQPSWEKIWELGEQNG